MEDRHRDAIQINFSSLVEQTDLNAIVAALYEKGVFSERMIEPYKENRDQRSRKRDLYMDIMRRGPHAFKNLVDTLMELGYWDLSRSLDPESPLNNRRLPIPEASAEDTEFLSIKNEKKKRKSDHETRSRPPAAVPPTNGAVPLTSSPTEEVDPASTIPQFNVIKSTKFFKDIESGTDIEMYKTRGLQRGALYVFSYSKFKDNVDTPREGADVDAANLKYLFTAMGFKVICFLNLTKIETLEALESMKPGLVGIESLFVVVSSHGYEREYSSDTDIRCYDGGLISYRDIVSIFNNINFPQLQGIPKVFIFQICRGALNDYTILESRTRTDGAGGAGPSAPATSPAAHARPDRSYSDILIAHSTLPGYVSRRDTKYGSWYIRTLCDVFARRAHDTHVETLFTIVDEELYKNHHVQTSSIDRWGFNKRLYLHPGLFESAADAASGADCDHIIK